MPATVAWVLGRRLVDRISWEGSFRRSPRVRLTEEADDGIRRLLLAGAQLKSSELAALCVGDNLRLLLLRVRGFATKERAKCGGQKRSQETLASSREPPAVVVARVAREHSHVFVHCAPIVAPRNAALGALAPLRLRVASSNSIRVRALQIGSVIDWPALALLCRLPLLARLANASPTTICFRYFARGFAMRVKLNNSCSVSFRAAQDLPSTEAGICAIC